ncbi:MAG: metal ABC transporter solute-binding protein, Zn/Mn family, partial [Nitrososphaeraceae archaeon]
MKQQRECRSKKVTLMEIIELTLIWLGPIFAKHQVDRIRDAMVRLDPSNANNYNQHADRFTAELDSLDSFFR